MMYLKFEFSHKSQVALKIEHDGLISQDIKEIFKLTNIEADKRQGRNEVHTMVNLTRAT